MTATYSQGPLCVHPLKWRPKGRGAKGKAWGTPTGEELATLLDSIQAALEGPIVRPEAITLLSDSYAMLLRCQAALPAVTEFPRGEEEGGSLACVRPTRREQGCGTAQS